MITPAPACLKLPICEFRDSTLNLFFTAETLQDATRIFIVLPSILLNFVVPTVYIFSVDYYRVLYDWPGILKHHQRSCWYVASGEIIESYSPSAFEIKIL